MQVRDLIDKLSELPPALEIKVESKRSGHDAAASELPVVRRDENGKTFLVFDK